VFFLYIHICSINIPSFEVLPGNNTYSWQSTLSVDDELSLVPILQNFFDEKEQTLLISYTMVVTALGMTFSFDSSQEYKLGEKKEGIVYVCVFVCICGCFILFNL